MSNPNELILTRITKDWSWKWNSIDELYSFCRQDKKQKSYHNSNFNIIWTAEWTFEGVNVDLKKDKTTRYLILITYQDWYSAKIFITHPSGGASLIFQSAEEYEQEVSRRTLVRKIKELWFKEKKTISTEELSFKIDLEINPLLFEKTSFEVKEHIDLNKESQDRNRRIVEVEEFRKELPERVESVIYNVLVSFKVKKFSSTELYVSTGEVSSVIKQILKAKLPGIKCYVRSEVFAWGDSISVYIPPEVSDEEYNNLEWILNRFKAWSFDGTTESYEYNYNSDRVKWLLYPWCEVSLHTKYLRVSHDLPWDKR